MPGVTQFQFFGLRMKNISHFWFLNVKAAVIFFLPPEVGAGVWVEDSANKNVQAARDACGGLRGFVAALGIAIMPTSRHQRREANVPSRQQRLRQR
jgi:hypothetical protein